MSTPSNRQGQGGGPHSAAGKRHVSRNAITHGLTSVDVVLPEEDIDEFAQFHDAMVADAQPVGADEQNAVERMVASQWKLRRLWLQESDVYATTRYRLKAPAAPVGSCLLGDMQAEGGFAQLTRQEAHLDRMYQRASKRLQELQDLRRKGLRHVIEAEAATPPAEPAADGATNQTAASPSPEPPEPRGAEDRRIGQPGAPSGPRQDEVTGSNHSPSGEIAKQTSAPPKPGEEAAQCTGRMAADRDQADMQAAGTRDRDGGSGEGERERRGPMATGSGRDVATGGFMPTKERSPGRQFLWAPGDQRYTLLQERSVRNPLRGHFLRPVSSPAGVPDRIPDKRGEAFARGQPRIRLPSESLSVIWHLFNNMHC